NPAVHRRHQRCRQRDCRRQPGPVAAHRATGRQPGRNRRLDGRTHFHRAQQRRACAARQPAGGRRRRGGLARWHGGRRSGRHHGRHPGRLAQDRRHHLGHRWHCVPDQYPGPECGGGSRTRRRTGARFCGGRLRGAYPGAALGRRGQGDQAADRRFGEPGRARQCAGQPGRPHHAGHRRFGARRHRDHARDQRSLAAAVAGYRTGRPDHRADGPGHPAERRAGGRSHRRRTFDGSTGAAVARCGVGVPAAGRCQAGQAGACRV
ncbi:hypothetical protein XPN_0583, partial [Xanthomonas arboricola pv. pruni MAFF 301427]